MVRAFLIAIQLFVAASTVVASEPFLISYWWGPPATEESMRRIAEANFTVAMCDGGRTALDLAGKHGLKAIMIDPRIMA